MVEKDVIFSSKVKYNGIFPFSDFYNFCYDWQTQEMGLSISEKKYSEKLKGESRDIEFEWGGSKKVTDYFKFEVSTKFKIIGLVDVELTQEGKKIKMNKGNIEIKAEGTLVRDYEGKFERSAFLKFIRGIYEKWVIQSRIKEYEDKLIGACEEFLNQVKAYLDLEGKR